MITRGKVRIARNGDDMRLTLYKIMRVVRAFEEIAKYALVAGWAVCLLSGGAVAICAAVVGIFVCAVTCIL